MHRVSLRTGTGSLPRHRRPQAYGFTLIEIMVVVVILGIMAALVVPNIAGRQEQAQRTAVESDLNALANALEFYRLDNFTYPTRNRGSRPSSPSPPATLKPGAGKWRLPAAPPDGLGNALPVFE